MLMKYKNVQHTPEFLNKWSKHSPNTGKGLNKVGHLKQFSTVLKNL